MCGCSSNCDCAITTSVGPQGPTGIGITSMVINGTNNLIATYTNGVTADLGVVIGGTGADSTVAGPTGATGPTGGAGAAGAAGTNGISGSDIVYMYNAYQNPTPGGTFGDSTVALNAWTTLQTYTIVSSLPANDYLEIDIKLLSNGELNIKDLPTDLFRIKSGTEYIINSIPAGFDTPELELLAMNKKGDVRRAYNLNLKVFAALPAFRPLSSMCNWSCSGNITDTFNHAGSIEVNAQQMQILQLNAAVALEFQIKQTVSRSVVIQTLVIKHVKQ